MLVAVWAWRVAPSNGSNPYWSGRLTWFESKATSVKFMVQALSGSSAWGFERGNAGLFDETTFPDSPDPVRNVILVRTINLAGNRVGQFHGPDVSSILICLQANFMLAAMWCRPVNGLQPAPQHGRSPLPGNW